MNYFHIFFISSLSLISVISSIETVLADFSGDPIYDVALTLDEIESGQMSYYEDLALSAYEKEKSRIDLDYFIQNVVSPSVNGVGLGLILYFYGRDTAGYDRILENPNIVAKRIHAYASIANGIVESSIRKTTAYLIGIPTFLVVEHFLVHSVRWILQSVNDFMSDDDFELSPTVRFVIGHTDSHCQTLYGSHAVREERLSFSFTSFIVHRSDILKKRIRLDGKVVTSEQFDSWNQGNEVLLYRFTSPIRCGSVSTQYSRSQSRK
jgi:hypothetical protein